MRIQDVCSHVPHLACFGEDHDDESPGAYIFCMTAQALEFLGPAKYPEHRPLKLCEESML